MPCIEELVRDADLVVCHAAANSIALPDGSTEILLGAKSNLPKLRASEEDKKAFYAAFNAASLALGISLDDIRASATRRKRLLPLAEDAYSLLSFAAANGKQVEDDVRNPLVSTLDSLSKGLTTAATEQAFLKAYQALTVKTSPVTADTLEASKTRLPDFELFFRRESFWSSLRGLTLGRFFNAIVFLLVLFATCVTLGYYSLGSRQITRYMELRTLLAQAEMDAPKKAELLSSREKSVVQEESRKPIDEVALAAARKALADAKAMMNAEKFNYAQQAGELDAIPGRLSKWSQQPCSTEANFAFKWTLCSVIDVQPSQASSEPSPFSQVEAARTVAAKLGDIYLPLLLGWLGASAFILRQMTREIAENSFAKASSLRHIVRSGLGALAGFSSTWLLTPEVVGGPTLKNIPVWALAFIAGYGIELVFAFMDRIVGAFTTKAP